MTTGEGGWKDIRDRVYALEQSGGSNIDVSQSTDGLELVGNQLRVDIRNLPLAPGS